MGWIIVGDTDKYEGCLVYTINGGKELAEQVLDRMMNNPNKEDLRVRETHRNLRIKETKPEDEWWNDPFLAN